MKNKKVWIIVGVLVIVMAIILAVLLTQKPIQKEERTIKIGAILPLTGDFSLFGGWLKEGIDFAIAEAQIPLKISYEDNTNQAAKSVSSFHKLVNVDKVQAIVTARTPMANALIPIISSAKIFTIFTFSDLPNGDKSYILNYHFPVADEVAALVEFAFNKLGQKGSILVVNDDFGRLGADLFVTAFKKKGGQILYQESFPSIESNFRQLLLKLDKSSPDFVFVIGWEQNFLALTKTMKEMKISIPIIGPNVLSIYFPLVKDYLPRSYFTMSLYDAGKSTGLPYDQFFNKFKEKTGKEPNMVVAEAYEATKILIDALSKNPNNLIEFFYAIKVYNGVFGRVVIDKERQAHFPIAVVEVEKGERKDIVSEFIPKSSEN